jgi:hypothetical protein
VTTENDSDEILTLGWPSITITVRDHTRNALWSSRQEIS